MAVGNGKVPAGLTGLRDDGVRAVVEEHPARHL